MKNNHELWKLLLSNYDISKADLYGLCIGIANLQARKLITADEDSKLERHLYKNRPSLKKHKHLFDENRDGRAWWWNNNDIRRKQFVELMIKITKT